MDKKLKILFLTLFMGVVITTSGFGATQKSQTLVRDGFVLTGVDGKLVPHESNEVSPESAQDRWFFEFDADFSNGRGLVGAGTRLELLPSSVLERMIADVNNNPDASYRLVGRVTRYRGKNFVFPTYFLPIAKTKKPQILTSQKSPRQEKQPTINDPNDVLTIPKELIEKLPDRKTRIDLRKRGQDTEETKPGDKRKSRPIQDSILADKCGFIHDKGHKIEGTWRQARFVPDALGRKESRISLRLLPCQALEQAQRKQSAEPDVMRFKTAGIVTKFKGNDYLLLQRVTRVYSHGNFPG
ncbi:MAG: hypothetical protein ACYS32_13260 [Planctomycetota bacterium]|jgi:hypothetical protein